MRRAGFTVSVSRFLAKALQNYLYYIGVLSGKSPTCLIISNIRKLFYSTFILLFGLWMISEFASPLLQSRDLVIGSREVGHLLYSPTTDVSYFEFIQYQLELFSAAALFFSWIHKKSVSSMILSLFWIYIFIDDFIRIHDSLGLTKINESLSRLGVTNFLYSELLYWLAIAVALGLIIYRPIKHKFKGADIIQLNLQSVVILFFYGVLVDLLGSLVGNGNYLVVGSLVFIEEFGEMSGLLFAFLANFDYLLRSTGAIKS